jgi:hypothetical protein
LEADEKVKPKVLFAVFAVLCLIPECVAQATYTYQGSDICFNTAQGRMCFSQGTLTAAAGNILQSQAAGQPYGQSFSRQNAAGVAVGNLIGALIAAWIEHHRQVEAKKRALKEELTAYLDAEIAVLEETKRLHVSTAEQTELLKKLDPQHLQTWESAGKDSTEIVAIDDKIIALKKSYRTEVQGWKTVKGLDYALNDSKAGEKNLYNNSLQMAGVAYVVNQFFSAIAGYFQQPKIQATLVSPSSTSRKSLDRLAHSCDKRTAG